MQVFLSYARKDLEALRNVLEAYLEQIARQLAADRLGELFRDTKGLKDYRDWREDLWKAIDKSYAMVALVSNSWLMSDVCWKEYEYATQSAKIPVIPIIYKIRDPDPEILGGRQHLWKELKRTMEDRTNPQMVEWVKNRVGLHEMLLGLENKDALSREASLATLGKLIIGPLQEVQPKKWPPKQDEADREWPNVANANALLNSRASAGSATVPQFTRIVEPSGALAGLGVPKTICYATSHALTLGEWQALLDLAERDVEDLSRSPPVHQAGHSGLSIILEPEWRAMIDQVLRDQNTLRRQPLSEIAGHLVGGFQLPELGKSELILLPGVKPGNTFSHVSIYLADDNSAKRNKPAVVQWKRAKFRLVFRSPGKVR